MNCIYMLSAVKIAALYVVFHSTSQLLEKKTKKLAAFYKSRVEDCVTC